MPSVLTAARELKRKPGLKPGLGRIDWEPRRGEGSIEPPSALTNLHRYCDARVKQTKRRARRHRQVGYILAMPDKPVTTYVVSVFEKPHWRTVLTTKDKAKPLAMAKEIGDKVRIEEITPKVKQR